MIANPMLQALVPLVDDLSRELPDSERYRRLLDAMRAFLPCDAVALLRLDGDWLVPLAVNGLSRDTLGRRFKIDEHPRFGLLLAGRCALPPTARCPTPMTGWWRAFTASWRCMTAWAARCRSVKSCGAC